MDTLGIVFVTVTVVLAVIAILLNLLVAAVIVAAEKITRNLACLIFLCIAHLELAVLMVIHRSIEIGVDHVGDSTYSTSSTNSSTGGDRSSLECTGIILVECLEKGAILWGISAITSLSINQYLYIEMPFWYGLNVTTKRLVLASTLAGFASHVIGLVPMMIAGYNQKDFCKIEDISGEKDFYLVFGIIIFIFFFVIVGLSVRMLVLAEGHRQKLQAYNYTLKMSRADSMKFFVILVVTYLIAYVLPAISGLVDAYNDHITIPHMKVNVLHLLGPIIYAILYGSRIPEGFLRSIRLAICCCLPVKPPEKDVEIADVVRLAVMRLGHVMVKIDEQAAMKRHSSYLKRRSRIISTMTFLKPSNSKPGDHKPLRPYKSLMPTIGRQEGEGAPTKPKEALCRAVSLDLAAVESNRSHPKVGRIFSWLPGYGATKATFEVPMTPKKEESVVEEAAIHLTAININASRKLSAITEKAESIAGHNSDDDASSVETHDDQSHSRKKSISFSANVDADNDNTQDTKEVND